MNPDGGLQTLVMQANHGRLFEGAQTKVEREPFKGIEFSLNGIIKIGFKS